MAAGGIGIDISKAAGYREELARFSSELSELIAGMKSALKSLGDSWKDDLYEDFCQEFSACMNQADSIQETCRTIVPQIDEAIEKAQNMESLAKNMR